jgi:hypothetical protein
VAQLNKFEVVSTLQVRGPKWYTVTSSRAADVFNSNFDEHIAQPPIAK